jgi:transcription elongation factor GreA
MTRICTRLTDLLAGGDEPLLRTLLGEADDGTLRGINTLLQRGVESEIEHMVTAICIDRDRHFYAGQSGPFWEGDSIWTTKIGLERRSAELRILVDDKIPANQEAIGRAASFGDLSENSEWEAAIADQRTLTARAMEIEEELRLAELLEEVALPAGIICPGSIVRYREVESGNEERIVILGPWDGEQWDGIQVVSYRAPLAAGLLGLKVGAVESITLPAGEIEIHVLEQEILAL